MSENTLRVILAQPEHSLAVYDICRLSYGIPLTEVCDDCSGPESLPQAIERFAAGQFVAVEGERVIGYGITLRTHHAPEADHHDWLDTIGDLSLSRHTADGEWLYLVDFAVHPAYQGRGMGRQLFEAAMSLSRQLGIKGCYGGGMLSGYYRYRNTLSLEAYAEKVQSGELVDPTVTAERKIGFELGRLLKNYADYDLSGDAAMLIVWRNPDYRPN